MSREDLLHRLEKALVLGGSTHSAQDVADDIENGAAQLWMRDDGLIVTYIENYPQCKVLFFWIAAGDLHDVLALEEEVCNWGREQGCTKARALGRPGWQRVLSAEHWTPGLIELTREL